MPGISLFLHPLDPGARIGEKVLAEFPQAEGHVPLDVHIGVGPGGSILISGGFMRFRFLFGIYQDTRRLGMTGIVLIDHVIDLAALAWAFDKIKRTYTRHFKYPLKVH
ncbi:MAG TPA: hypothetical protein VMW42_02435 [Desulfatiglandales bacterium]|nr:hypothetical protein [Desulfatiglandales bacterium]